MEKKTETKGEPFDNRALCAEREICDLLYDVGIPYKAIPPQIARGIIDNRIESYTLLAEIIEVMSVETYWITRKKEGV